MLLSHPLNRVRSIFAVAVLCILVSFFMLGVTLRKQEIAFITTIAQAIRSTAYTAEYALVGTPGTTAAAGVAFSDSPGGHATGTAVAVPVLVYHGIVRSSDRFSLTEEKFKDQLFALKRAGYQTVSLADFTAHVRGEKELPVKSFLLTFDDGRRDSYVRGDPVLKALGYTAVMFVATEDSLEAAQMHNDYYLDASTLRQMRESGRWEIGSHARQVGGGFVSLDGVGTKGNFLSNRQWLRDSQRLETLSEYRDRLNDELGESKKKLEESFTTSVNSFSYPFGDYGQQQQNEPQAAIIINSIIRQHYQVAFEQVWPGDTRYSANYSYDDPYHLRRVEVETSMRGTDLVSLLEGVRGYTLPYREDFHSLTAWKHNWGYVTMRNSSIILDAFASSTGALTFLDGTAAWTNYVYQADAQIKEGTTLSLVGRYSDERSFLSCTFSDSIVRLKERVHGIEKIVAERTYRVPLRSHLEMDIRNSNASCSVDGAVVLSGSVSPTLSRGGIGLAIWDETVGSASATLTTIAITPL